MGQHSPSCTALLIHLFPPQEYQTPFEFLGRTEAIVPDLIANAGWSEGEIFGAGCDPAFRLTARAVFSNRLPQLLPELGDAIR